MSKRREKKRSAEGGLPPGAVPADRSKQGPTSSYSGKPAFYTDKHFVCIDCGSEECWTAKQQKWYYEEAGGSLYSTAVRCRDCRRKLNMKQANQRGQISLPRDETDTED